MLLEREAAAGHHEDVWASDTRELLGCSALEPRLPDFPEWLTQPDTVADSSTLEEALQRRLQAVRFLAWQQAQIGEDLIQAEAGNSATTQELDELQGQLSLQKGTKRDRGDELSAVEAQFHDVQERCCQEAEDQVREMECSRVQLEELQAELDLAMSLNEKQLRELAEAQQELRASELRAEQIRENTLMLGDQQEELETREAALRCMESSWGCIVQQAFGGGVTAERQALGDDLLDLLRSAVSERLVDEVCRLEPSIAARQDLADWVVLRSLGGGRSPQSPLSTVQQQIGAVGPLQSGALGGPRTECLSAASTSDGEEKEEDDEEEEEDIPDYEMGASIDACPRHVEQPNLRRKDPDADLSNISVALPATSEFVGLNGLVGGLGGLGGSSCSSLALASEESAYFHAPRCDSFRENSLRSVSARGHDAARASILPPDRSARLPQTPKSTGSYVAGSPHAQRSPQSEPHIASALRTPLCPQQQCMSHQPVPNCGTDRGRGCSWMPGMTVPGAETPKVWPSVGGGGAGLMMSPNTTQSSFLSPGRAPSCFMSPVPGQNSMCTTTTSCGAAKAGGAPLGSLLAVPTPMRPPTSWIRQQQQQLQNQHQHPHQSQQQPVGSAAMAGQMLHGLPSQRASGPVMAPVAPSVAATMAPAPGGMAHVVVRRQVTRSSGPCVLVQRF